MKLDFRIEWGYQILYSRRHYHPVYCWDGSLDCSHGTVEKLSLYHYPRSISGPVNSPKVTQLSGNSWQESTRRGISGLLVEAEVGDDTVFFLRTASGDFTFSAAEIINCGRKVFNVGPKYGNCHVSIIRDGFIWFRPELREGEVAVDGTELDLPCHHWMRMKSAWLSPETSVKFQMELSKSGKQIFHLSAMAAQYFDPETENQVNATFPLILKCDGVEVSRFKHYFRRHARVQLLEDVWARFSADAGTHEFELVNGNSEFQLLINRMSIFPSTAPEEELVLPEWALTGEKLYGRIHTAKAHSCRVAYEDENIELELQPGWNEFSFVLKHPGRNVEFVTDTGLRAVIACVQQLPQEKLPLMVGADLTSVPHDDSGELDWLLDYMNRTRLGNLIVIRNFITRHYSGGEKLPVCDELLEKWGNYCREHGIYVEAVSDFQSGALVRAAGEMMHAAGNHELTGAVYAFDPDHEKRPASMKEACENYIAFLRGKAAEIKKAVSRAGLGDASGGQRYCYQAGIDFIRAETMVPNTMHICSLARTASESLANGEWGVHIATQHAMQPYFTNQLGLFFLSLYQPYLMGANMFYEEDSLFLMWKEERQCWDDALTKGKRDLLRKFYRFASTHPRQGKSVRQIAFLEGRYAAPFNGFVCDYEQDPGYSVWGKFGRNLPEWGHNQVEKCRHLLDVLMPGCLTHPLRQKFDKQRHFFCGTPYGDFDEVPVEADGKFLNRYKLLLNFGWNTLLEEDYEKLCNFVKEGGTLFSGLPQFGTQEKRDISDFRLFRQGDLSELCGVRVYGAAQQEYSGQWNGRERNLVSDVELSAAPSFYAGEDGACKLASIELAGAEVVAWDAANGMPLLTCFKYGKGKVYLLTAWAYPGHEKLQSFAASYLAYLAGQCRPRYFVEDPSKEVFWSARYFDDDGKCGLISLLNTDWTKEGNGKPVTVNAGKVTFDHTVIERQLSTFTVAGDTVIECDAENYLEFRGIVGTNAHFLLHSGHDEVQLTLHTPEGCRLESFQVPPEGCELKIPLNCTDIP